jgi:hypothetical protein
MSSDLSQHDLQRAFRALSERAALPHVGGPSEFAHTMWLAHAAELRLRASAFEMWSTKADGDPVARIAKDAPALYTSSAKKYRGAIVHRAGALALVEVYRDRDMHVLVAAPSDAEATATLDWLKKLFPEVGDETTGVRVPVTFWSYGSSGATQRSRTLETTTWAEIQGNYTSTTRRAIAPLMESERIDGTGKLMLWLGPPGTGKTFALRALAWEQRKRVRIHYVLDPEAFLTHVDYLSEVVAEGEMDDEEYDLPEANRTERPRLVVLEDSGELLGADAKARVGQGLSRLLNVTDGLPGQGTRTQFLITTNEDIGRLHPAIVRAGRCTAPVRFGALEPDEVAAWLRARGGDEREVPAPRSATCLADLFALVRGEVPLVQPARRPGFSVAS